MLKQFLKSLIITVLTLEARLMLARYKPKIVAVTGTVGKTSTKDALHGVLVGHFRVRKSEKSFNSHMGIPLTILGLPSAYGNPFLWARNILFGLGAIFFSNNYPDWLVMEVGAGEPGDIKRFGNLLHPDAVVVTRLSDVPVHVEFFKSPKEVIKEKSFLVQSLKDDGTLFLNSDDSEVMALRDSKRQCKLAIFGIEEPADFQASNLEITYEKNRYGATPAGITFKVNRHGNAVPISLRGALGRQHVYPALAALAFGESLGLNIVDMADSIARYTAPPGRMRIISGVKHTTIIDDSYNSSPVAVAEALRTLGEIKTDGGPDAKSQGKKIAVLGDMLELGKYSAKAHEKAGEEAAAAAGLLVTVGLRARDIAMGALDNGLDEKNIFQFEDATEAGKFVEEIMRERDIVLVKGSQGMRLEKIVEEIMAYPKDKEKLLVRQGPEWLKR
ncbi:MAG: UDP-N-acetylmuramoyl-tripeptide--D-alanyl-D-alanine ligase [Candidatus Taylorbacteria bacterium]|nr:UDP-N-acetylmuramoyl-tripeptide--D-alanyl-D-alanine ligase [Candidatus Taylorbacteria bacterium]